MTPPDEISQLHMRLIFVVSALLAGLWIGRLVTTIWPI
jgi:hypothetical protein